MKSTKTTKMASGIEPMDTLEQGVLETQLETGGVGDEGCSDEGAGKDPCTSPSGSDSGKDSSSGVASGEGRQLRARKPKDYNLRQSSLINRIQTERRRSEPKQQKPKSKPPPLSKYRRRTANARERGRMHEINEAFDELQKVVPQYPDSSTKPTKITTLRLAMNYIQALRDMLGYSDGGADTMSGDDGGATPCPTSPLGSTGSTREDSSSSVPSDTSSEGHSSPGHCSGLDSEGEVFLPS